MISFSAIAPRANPMRRASASSRARPAVSFGARRLVQE
jgi:hypothetical protein